MNQDIKDKWINALRSGEYKQGTGALKNSNDAFCCLGVLCDIHAKETDTRWVDAEEGWLSNYLGNDGSLPDEVIEWADLEGMDPVICFHFISTYNDKKGYSFDQLADLIEKHL